LMAEEGKAVVEATSPDDPEAGDIEQLTEQLTEDVSASPLPAHRFGLNAVGVIGSLLVYGQMQERIMTRPYNSISGTPDFFRYSPFLVLVNRVLAALYAAVMLKATGSSLRPQSKLRNYACIATTNVVSSTCQYEALKHVSFVLQTLAKSGKMMPVMISGCLVLGKRYHWTDILTVIFVSLGIVVFSVAGVSASFLDPADKFCSPSPQRLSLRVLGQPLGPPCSLSTSRPTVLLQPYSKGSSIVNRPLLTINSFGLTCAPAVPLFLVRTR